MTGNQVVGNRGRQAELAFWGVTPILRYDPLGRLVRTELPDGMISRVAFAPWQSATFDGNDTVLEAGNAWYASRQASASPTPSAEEQRAATLTATHAGTVCSSTWSGCLFRNGAVSTRFDCLLKPDGELYAAL